jgi:ABC-type transporter Mla maintaining outer membrane lipid asymmetry ATPase subunit MlaF
MISAQTDIKPLSADFEEFIEATWIEKVQPALVELEEHTRKARFREYFFDDVVGDLKTYAGPAMAVVGGSLAGLSAIQQIAMATIGPAAVAVASAGKRRKEIQKNEFIFLHHVEKRIRRNLPTRFPIGDER